MTTSAFCRTLDPHKTKVVGESQCNGYRSCQELEGHPFCILECHQLIPCQCTAASQSTWATCLELQCLSGSLLWTPLLLCCAPLCCGLPLCSCSSHLWMNVCFGLLLLADEEPSWTLNLFPCRLSWPPLPRNEWLGCSKTVFGTQ